jgi:hypothetical protein
LIGSPFASRVREVTRPRASVILTGVPHRLTLNRVMAPPGWVTVALTESGDTGVKAVGFVGPYGTATFCQAAKSVTGEPDVLSKKVTDGAITLSSSPDWASYPSLVVL